MISGIRSALAGLLGFQKKVAAAAHNTANLETDGYKKTRVVLEENAAGGVAARSERLDVPGPVVYEETAEGPALVEKSNVDLAEEIPALLLSRRYYQANLKSLETGDEMLGTLLDRKG